MRLGRAGRGGAGARLADRGLHLVEVRLLVEVRCERLGEQPGQHVREREEEQACDELRAARTRLVGVMRSHCRGAAQARRRVL